MAGYFDARTGLPKPSWDLWEERWGVHAFTVGSVWAGLEAARRFADLFGDQAEKAKFEAAQKGLRKAVDKHLYRPELGRFARRVTLDGRGGVTADPVLDSSLHGLWRFGMYSPRDPRIVQTMEAIRDELSVKSAAGGQARYANDYYFQVDTDVSRVPGNPWFICTLWLAQWYIAIATAIGDLEPARKIIDWVCAHELPGGLLSEQVDPHTGAPLSVSPLTWSHAEFVVTVEEYLTRLELVTPG
jgi:GH15 family glucan-1,4-alpha-glucosidase